MFDVGSIENKSVCKRTYEEKKVKQMNCTRMGMHRKKAKDTSLSKNYLIMIFR